MKFFSFRLFTALVISLFVLDAAWAGDSSSGERLRVVEVSERLYQGGPAISVILSDKLDPEKPHDSYLSVYTDGQPVSGGWVLSDNGQVLYFPDVSPETRYTVLVRRGLTALNGNSLPSHEEREVTTKPITPSFGFASHGSVLPEKLTAGLPIMTVNVDAVDIEFLRVKDDKITEFMQTAARESATSRYDLDRLHPFVESVYLARFNTHAEKNKRTVTHIPVEQIEQLSRPGYYVAVMNAPGRYDYNMQTSYFFISDIGVHVRLYKNGLYTICSSLKTGKALADVKVFVYNRKGKLLKSGYTDVYGRLALEVLPEKPFLITALRQEHVSFVALNDAALDLSGFSVDGPMFRPMEIFVYSPRDLYRPGETVEFSALLRDFDGRMTENLPLEARIKRPDGKEVSRFTWLSETIAHYYRSFTLPSDAPTGKWTLEVRTDPSESRPLRVFTFRVEEFLPERMKLTLETDQEILKPEEPFTIEISGQYLYGASASNNRLTLSANIRRDIHPVEGLKEFHFGNPDDEMKDSRRDLADVRLGPDGTYEYTFNPFETPPTSPMRIVVTGSLFETGGRPVTRSIGRTLWPSSFLVGIRPLFDEDRSPTDTMVQFEVAKSDPEGNLQKASHLQVSLVKEDREYYWQYSDSQGWHWNFSETHYPVYRQDLSIEAGQLGKLSIPVNWGQYRLEIHDPETGLQTRYRFYAGWYRERDAMGSRPDKVKLSLDKPAYRPGDTAVLTLTPAHDGDAIILVESNRALWFKRTEASSSGTQVKIPIHPDWNRHDIYITAMVLRGAEAAEKITPNRAMGVLHLPLERAPRKLELALEAPESMEPEKQLTVKAKVANFDNASTGPVFLTVAAVDVGVLNITDFKTPDPFSFFFAKRRYGVDIHDLYGQVIENLSGVKATQKFGGDADLSGFRGSKRDRAEVKILSLFSKAVPVDDHGEAEVSFRIPDFNGTARLMAVAFSPERFGSAQKEIVIRAPVVAELAMARFLASGDKSVVTLELHNLSGTDQNLTVRVQADPPLAIEDGDTSVVLPDGERTALRYPLSAVEDFGVGKVKVSVKGQKVEIQREWELTVRPAWPGIVRAKRQVVKPGEKITVPPAMGENIMENTLDAYFNISPNPPLNMSRVLKSLLRYPYGCLEQTTSRAFPYVYLNREAADRLGVEPVADMTRVENVEKALVRIAGMQKANGGFSFWGNTGPEALWLTPYAAQFMLDARDNGFPVPETMLQKTLERLLARLQASGSFSVSARESSPELEFADKAFAGYVLARVNRAPLGTLSNLFDHHRQIAKTGLPLMHLGIALHLQGDPKRGQTAVLEGVDIKRDPYHYIGDYGSEIRDNAMIVHLLRRHGMEVPDLDRLMMRLDENLRGRMYLSTQEKNALFLAALALMGDTEQWTGSMKVGDKTRQLAEQGRFTAVYGAGQLASGIEFTSENKNPLYCAIEVAGYPKAPPEPETEHATITRNFYTLDGHPVEGSEFTVGDLFMAHLKIAPSKAMHDALLIDLLPAGLELENQNLAHSEKLTDLEIDGVKIGKVMEKQLIRHMEFRDDRFVAAMELHENQTCHLLYLVRVVTPGTYRMPAPFLEDMYRPEIRAIGADSGKITVKEP